MAEEIGMHPSEMRTPSDMEPLSSGADSPPSPRVLEAVGAFVASLVIAVAAGLFFLRPPDQGPGSTLTYGQLSVQVVFGVSLGGSVLIWYSLRGGKGSLRLTGRGWVRSAVLGAAGGFAVQLGVIASFWLAEMVIPGFDAARAQGIVEKSIGESAPDIQIAFVFAAGLLAPVAEELYFRGMLLSALEARAPRSVAVGVSAICFAAIHFNLVALAPFLLLGVVLAVMDIRRNSLIPSIAAHITFNLSALAALLAMPPVS